MSDNTNLPSGGSGTIRPSDSYGDNLDDYDFEEQDREPVNPSTEEPQTDDDSETTEAESQEVENPEGEPEEGDENADEGEEAEKPEPTDDVTVKLPTGEAVPLAELKNGYMRDRDYRIKTTQVAETRRDLEAQAVRVSQTVDAVADFLARQLPPEPNAALLYTDPQAHYRERAIYDAALGQIHALIELGSAPKQAVSKMTDQQRSEILATENARLAEVFPITTKPESRRKFFEGVTEAAMARGFSLEEVQNVTDHRMLAILDDAAFGRRAREAQAKAKGKVQNVPAVSPPRRQQTASAAAIKGRQEARQRLQSSGRLEDAMGLID
jgi:hypothetical protein